MIIHRNIIQGTVGWMRIRAGLPTASNFDRIMTAGADDWDGGSKGAPKPSSQRHAYMNHLLAERILGRPVDGFQSQWMARGNEMEDRAIASYELDHDCETETIGFVTTDDGTVGCSPDRFIVGNDDLMVEAKAPSPGIHVGYLRCATGAAQSELWVCEKMAVDIVSYHPGMPDAVFRVTRNQIFIDELTAQVRSFSRELEEISADYVEKGWIKPFVPQDDQQDSPAFITDDDLQFFKEFHKV